jgi:hypothetical protein
MPEHTSLFHNAAAISFGASASCAARAIAAGASRRRHVSQRFSLRVSRRLLRFARLSFPRKALFFAALFSQLFVVLKVVFAYRTLQPPAAAAAGFGVESQFASASPLKGLALPFSVVLGRRR